MAERFKTGDIVECVDAGGVGNSLTEGKVYTVAAYYNNGWVQIEKNDKGFSTTVLAERFETPFIQYTGDKVDPLAKEVPAIKLPALPSSWQSQVGGDHYKKLKIQPAQYSIANGLGFAEGNIIKYVTRWKDKNGVEDLKKAAHMLQVLIEEASKETNAN
jgi:uncharacterized protein (DUF2237 family)